MSICELVCEFKRMKLWVAVVATSIHTEQFINCCDSSFLRCIDWIKTTQMLFNAIDFYCREPLHFTFVPVDASYARRVVALFTSVHLVFWTGRPSQVSKVIVWCISVNVIDTGFTVVTEVKCWTDNAMYCLSFLLIILIQINFAISLICSLFHYFLCF